MRTVWTGVCGYRDRGRVAEKWMGRVLRERRMGRRKRTIGEGG